MPCEELHVERKSQALAAIGQGRLIALYDALFGNLDQPIAQVLLTRGDISDVRDNHLDIHLTYTEFLVTAYSISECSQHIQRADLNGGRAHRERK